MSNSRDQKYEEAWNGYGVLVVFIIGIFIAAIYVLGPQWGSIMYSLQSISNP